MNQNWQDIQSKMVNRAKQQLQEYRMPVAKDRILLLGKRILKGEAKQRDLIFWPAGLLMTGLLEAGEKQAVEEYLHHWMDEGSPVLHPDDALTGSVILGLYAKEEETQQKQNEIQMAERIYSYLVSCRRDANGTIVYGQGSNNSWIYADGAGQTALFFSRYAKVMKVNPSSLEMYKKARKEAADGLCAFFQNGMDESSFLPYHGYDLESGVKLGVIGWGRAVGWLLMGLTEYCIDFLTKEEEDTKKEDAVIWSGTVKMIAAVCQRVRKDGMFSWQLDCKEGPLDTSATGMICYSLFRLDHFLQHHPECNEEGFCLEKTGMDDSFFHAAASGLFHYVDEEGNVMSSSAECIDFGQYRQQYGNYPWGQGAVLSFLSLYDA